MIMTSGIDGSDELVMLRVSLPRLLKTFVEAVERRSVEFIDGRA